VLSLFFALSVISCLFLFIWFLVKEVIKYNSNPTSAAMGASNRISKPTRENETGLPINITFSKSYDPDELQSTDSWEGGFWEASDPKKLNATLLIDYCDAKGDKTRRGVSVRQFDNDLYGGMVIGHCLLRNATRTFRFDRIKACVDMETGEVVDDIKSYLNDLYEKSPDRLTDLLVSDYIDILKVLYFIAKADGQYMASEKKVIADYLRQLMRDNRLTDTMVNSAIRGVSVPSFPAFKLALGRVLKGGWVDPEKLKECCYDIVKTQKTIHPNEQAALDYIDKKYAAFQKESKDTVSAPQPA